VQGVNAGEREVNINRVKKLHIGNLKGKAPPIMLLPPQVDRKPKRVSTKKSVEKRWGARPRTSYGATGTVWY